METPAQQVRSADSPPQPSCLQQDGVPSTDLQLPASPAAAENAHTQGQDAQASQQTMETPAQQVRSADSPPQPSCLQQDGVPSTDPQLPASPAAAENIHTQGQGVQASQQTTETPAQQVRSADSPPQPSCLQQDGVPSTDPQLPASPAAAENAHTQDADEKLGNTLDQKLLNFLHWSVYLNYTFGLMIVFNQLQPQEIQLMFQHKLLQQSLHHMISYYSLELIDQILGLVPGLVDVENEEGLTVLYRAIVQRKTGLVKLLLKHNASVQKTEASFLKVKHQHKTLVLTAISTMDLELLQMIVQAGGNVGAVSKDGVDCFQEAAKTGILPIFDYLETVCARREYTSIEAHPAYFALRYSHKEMFGKLWRELDTSQKEFILLEDIFINSTPLVGEVMLNESKEFRIVYLELIGAWYLNLGCFDQGADNWKKAMSLRWDNTNSPILKKPIRSPLREVLAITEVQTKDDVDNLSRNPLVLRMQATLVAERHLPTRYPYLWFLLDLAQQFLVSGNREHAVEIIHLIFCVINKCQHDYQNDNRAVYNRKKLLKMVRDIMKEGSCEVPFKYILCLMKSCQSELQHIVNNRSLEIEQDTSTDLQNNIHSVLDTFAEGLSMLYRLRKSATPEDEAEVVHCGRTFLQVSSAIPLITIFHTSFLHLPLCDPIVVKSLVNFSCVMVKEGKTSDPLHLAKDKDGKTPLHVFAEKLSKKKLVEEEIIDFFLNRGADLCSRDKEGKRIRDILIEREIITPGEYIPSLQCLAARMVARLDAEGKVQLGDTFIRGIVSKH